MGLLREKLGKHSSKLFASLITFVVLGILFFAGPANAFSLILGDFSEDKPIQGEVIYIESNIEIESSERIVLNYINLSIDGVVACVFNAYTGEDIEGCEDSGIEIDLIGISEGEEYDYGYGYGYAYGEGYGYGYNYGYSDSVFNYNISINTSSSFYEPGEYEISLATQLGSQDYESDSKTFIIGVGIDSDDEIFDGVGFLLPEGESDPQNISNVTTNNDWLINQSLFEVLIPEGTTISPADGTTLNVTAITSELITTLSELSGLNRMIGALQFGIPNFGLTFSSPITIKISVGSIYEGRTLEIWRSTSGDGNWTQDGIEEPKTCTVLNGICEFNTTKASYFATATQSSSGGSCRTEWTCTEWSSCINGAQTRVCSYPEKYCTPKDEKPTEVLTCYTTDGQLSSPPLSTPIEEPISNEEEKKGFFSFLTGNAISEGLARYSTGIMVVVILLGMIIAITLYRRRKD